MRRNVILHFMNRDARDISGIRKLVPPQQQEAILSRAINAAVLLCEEHTVMPPGFFLESSLSFGIVDKKLLLIEAGLIAMPRREVSLELLIEKKRSEYGSVRHEFEGLFDDNRIRLLTESAGYFMYRKTKIGEAATTLWEKGPDALEMQSPGQTWKSLKNLWSTTAVESARNGPRMLLDRGEALTWPALVPHLNAEALSQEPIIRLLLQQNYFKLYVDEYQLVGLIEVPHFVHDFAIPSGGRTYSYRCLAIALDVLGVGFLLDASARSLTRIKRSSALVRFMDCYVQVVEMSGSQADMISWLGRAAKTSGFPAFTQHHRFALTSHVAEVELTEKQESDLIGGLDSLCDALEAEHGLRTRKVAPVNTGRTLVIEKSASSSTTSRQASQGDASKAVNIILATANIREARATLSLLIETQRKVGGSKPVFLHSDGVLPRWELTLYEGSDSARISVVQADETGGGEAADLLRRCVAEVLPDAVFFVGCAAVLDEKAPFRENTVYLARRGIDADKAEVTDDAVLYDMDQYHGDLSLRRVLTGLSIGGAFEPVELITNRDFISGSIFLRSRFTERRADLVKRFPPDAVVLEMEAFEIYKEVYRMRSSGSSPAVAVLKGVSDVGDDRAQAGKENSQRNATQNAVKVVLTYLAFVTGRTHRSAREA